MSKIKSNGRKTPLLLSYEKSPLRNAMGKILIMLIEEGVKGARKKSNHKAVRLCQLFS